MSLRTQVEKSADQLDYAGHETQDNRRGRIRWINVVEREQRDDGCGTDGDLPYRSEYDVHQTTKACRIQTELIKTKQAFEYRKIAIDRNQ